MRTASILLIIVLCALVPSLVLSFYAHPATDDFVYAEMVRENGFFKAQSIFYFISNGRFIATLFLSSGVFFLNHYCLVPLLMILMLLIGSWLATAALFARDQFRNRLIFFAIGLLIFLLGIPSVYQCFYWLTAVATYTAGIACLYFAAYFLFVKKSRSLAVLFAAMACGCSEVFCLLLLGGIVLFFPFRRINTRRWLPSLLFLIAVMVVVFVAPGNFIRMGVTAYSGHFLIGLGGGLFSAFFFLLKSLLILIPGGCLMLAAAAKYNAGIKDSLSWKAALLRLLLLFAGSEMFVVFLAGSMPEGRVENIFWAFTVTSLLYLVLLAGGDGKKYFWKKSGVQKVLWIAGSIGLLVNCLSPFNSFNWVCSDAFGGQGFAFQSQMNRAEKLLNDTSKKDIVLPQLTVFPASLFHSATFDTVRDVSNRTPAADMAAAWYGKHSVYYPLPLQMPVESDNPLKVYLKELREKLVQ